MTEYIFGDTIIKKDRVVVVKRRSLGIIIMVVLLVGSGLLFLSQVELPEKENPKLDSQLNQLVGAERRGEAASFAQQSNIELVDGRVRVIIECLPGQVDTVTEAATALGASVEASYSNLVQAVVSITDLTTLANMANVHFIRLPPRPVLGNQRG